MKQQQTASVYMFGIFHTLRRERGLSPAVDMPLAQAGRPALELARELNLPLEMVGAVYCNHAPTSLARVIRPGDRIAFIPLGVPGPHKCLQGFPALNSRDEPPTMPQGFNSTQLSCEDARISLS